jgi:hypothetical protein
MNAKDHRILNGLYIESCEALLSSYGLTVDVQEDGESPGGRSRACYISVLSASGEGISVSSMLRIDQNLVISLHPLPPADISQPDLEDWCLELNNQLVGRVKNKLLNFGRALVVGLPVLLTGTNVTGVAAPNSEVHRYSVESANGQIVFTLATLIAPGVELQEFEAASGDEAALVEGALALF